MRYDERENLMQYFPPDSHPTFKELCRFAMAECFLHMIWNNTSHLGSHRVLPTGRCPSKIPETFELEMLGCQILFSSRSGTAVLSAECI